MTKCADDLSGPNALLCVADKRGFSAAAAALEALAEARDRPTGKPRLKLPRLAFRLVIERLSPAFLTAYPQIELEILIDDRGIGATRTDRRATVSGTPRYDYVMKRPPG